MEIRLGTKKDLEEVSVLLAHFRLEHKLIKGISSSLNIEQARIEYIEYLDSGFPVYVALNDEEEFMGFIVLRVEEKIVWVEVIYVSESFRRMRVAESLYKKAECFAIELGGETLYNWILPNNHKIVSFLSKQGYDVLNMIEIRKLYENEQLENTIVVGEHKYRY